MPEEKLVAFYVAPHQDDWQLFMSPQANVDVHGEGRKVVFIYVTAGDAGQGSIYWKARRAGALASVRFLTKITSEVIEPEMVSLGEGSPTVPCFTVGNTRSYFLNLPDGNTSGEGFQETVYNSLKTLADGRPCPILAEDGSLVPGYETWNDLVATLAAILARESAEESRDHSFVGFLDPARDCLDSHEDHRLTSCLVQAAIRGKPKFTPVRYMDYGTKAKDENVFGDELSLKSACFFIYNDTARRSSLGKYPYPGPDYFEWLRRQLPANPEGEKAAL